MPDLNLPDIEARAAAATEGPWEWDTSGVNLETKASMYTDVIDISHDHGCACRRLCELEVNISDEDRAFIAHARTDVPDLLARVRELEGEVAEIRALARVAKYRPHLNTSTETQRHAGAVEFAGEVLGLLGGGEG